MAQDQQTVACAAGQFTQVSNADVSAEFSLRITGGPAYLRFTTDTSTPAATAGGMYLPAGTAILNRTIGEFAHATGMDRIWVAPALPGDTVSVWIDHA